MLRELGNRRDFAVKVVGEGVLEGAHDTKQLVAQEVARALEATKVLFKLGKTGQESLCDRKSVSCFSHQYSWTRVLWLLTMLLMSFLKDSLVLQQVLDLGEQRLLFVVMMRLDESVPGQAVADKVGLVLVGNMGSLLVDGVVAAEDRVVQ